MGKLKKKGGYSGFLYIKNQKKKKVYLFISNIA